MAKRLASYTMNEPEAVRVDKWLFAVRLFKTRSQAADACRNGKVRLNDAPTKAAKPLKPGDSITVRQSPITRLLKVVGLTERRVGAKLVPNFATEETPPAELEKLRQAKRKRAGDGHPTKRNRRLIQRFIDGNQS